MEEKLDLNKKSFNKFQYEKVINTKFSQLATSFSEANNPPSLSPPVLIDEFFQKYNQLFFDIPKNGATNSHEYLIKRSSEYVDFQVMNDEMLALIDEINALQAQNLELNQKIVEIQLPKI
tara:strand:+ start:4525 stop:4884 length:360 start_codon:yes stop_codon:yes gene_type:complete